jgi:hypothetical protein
MLAGAVGTFALTGAMGLALLAAALLYVMAYWLL